MASFSSDTVVAKVCCAEQHEVLSTASVDGTSDCDDSDSDETRSRSPCNISGCASDNEDLDFEGPCSEGLVRSDVQLGDIVSIVQGPFAGQNGALVDDDDDEESDVQCQGIVCPLRVELRSGKTVWFAQSSLEFAGRSARRSAASLFDLGSSELADSDTETGDDRSDSDELDFFYPIEHAYLDVAPDFVDAKFSPEDSDGFEGDLDCAHVDGTFSDHQGPCIHSAACSEDRTTIGHQRSSESSPCIRSFDCSKDMATVGHQRLSEASSCARGLDSKSCKRKGSMQWMFPELLSPSVATDSQGLQDAPIKRARVELPAVPETIAPPKFAQAWAFGPNGPQTLAEVESKVEFLRTAGIGDIDRDNWDSAKVVLERPAMTVNGCKLQAPDGSRFMAVDVLHQVSRLMNGHCHGARLIYDGLDLEQDGVEPSYRVRCLGA